MVDLILIDILEVVVSVIILLAGRKRVIDSLSIPPLSSPALSPRLPISHFLLDTHKVSLSHEILIVLSLGSHYLICQDHICRKQSSYPSLYPQVFSSFFHAFPSMLPPLQDFFKKILSNFSDLSYVWILLQNAETQIKVYPPYFLLKSPLNYHKDPTEVT